MHVKLRPGGTDSYPLWGLHNLGRRNYPAATVIFLVLPVSTRRWCGQLSQPLDDGCESDDGMIISSGFFEASGNAAELLELAEAAFHEMSLGIMMLVERIFERAGRVVGNDGERALVCDRLAQVVGVIGCIGHDDLGR